MDKLKTTKQIFMFMTILTIAVIISYSFFFYNIKEKNKMISLMTNETDAAIQREVKLRSVKDLIKDTQENRLKLDTYFVVDDKIVNFIEEIEELSRDVGVDTEVVSVNVDEGKANNISELLKLDLNIEGKWEDVFQFITLIEKMSFKISVSQASLQVIYDNESKISSGIWKGFLSINVVKLK
ncbi:MAG: hypothetical protein ISR98_00855 [Parcubacteria group bacterium]|nr:hypothetical protein [Parcubacteria group bacterium]